MSTFVPAQGNSVKSERKQIFHRGTVDGFDF